MKHYTLSTKALSFSVILSCGMFIPQIVEAQKANKILDLLQQGKISKAVEKRNQIYSNDDAKELMLADICDCILFNTKEYKAYDPYKAYSIFKDTYLKHKDNKDANKFLIKHKTSFLKIQTQIENNILADAKVLNTEEGYSKAISVCDSCSYLSEAKVLQEEVAYNNAISEGTLEGYNYFLSHYPESKKVEEITALADKMIFEKLDNTIEAYSAFIQQYPKSKLVAEAQNRIYNLAYDNAIEQNTLEAYNGLIQRYPNHPKKEEIQNKIEELSFKSLSTDFTMKAYDSFISKFPQSKYTVQANALVKPINQNEWHWKSNGLKGYVKSTTETSSKEGSKNNSNSTDIITQYNELGEVILEQTTTGKDVKITQILYHPDFSLSAIIESNGRKRYDYKNGQLNKITFINSRKKESPIATFKYDNGGRLIERTDYITGVKGSTITHYTYNANDSIISSKKYKSTTPKNTTIQQYIDGKVVSSTETIGKQTTQKRYAYNDKGDLIKITTTKNNKDTENITYEYLYDETGNWTKQSMFINGTLNIVRQRVIEYFYK